jgi:hypothetical protein
MGQNLGPTASYHSSITMFGCILESGTAIVMEFVSMHADGWMMEKNICIPDINSNVCILSYILMLSPLSYNKIYTFLKNYG